VVLEYAWQEVVQLTKTGDLDFVAWNGKAFHLDCGGTLVFDGRGNLLSWSRKPGTEHLTPEEARKIQNRTKPNKLEKALLEDLQIGEQRKRDLLTYLSTMIKRRLVGSPTAGRPPRTSR
jgi:hypothetical protein